MFESIERQQVRLANEAAERWGELRPRWWVARYGALHRCSGDGSKELNKDYRNHYRRISGRVKPIRESLMW